MNPKDAKEKIKAVEVVTFHQPGKSGATYISISTQEEKKNGTIFWCDICIFSNILHSSGQAVPAAVAFLQNKPICAEIILSILMSHAASAYVQNQYVVTLSKDHRKDNKWASSQGLDASLILSFVFSHNHHIDLKRAPVELNNTFNTNTIKCQSYTRTCDMETPDHPRSYFHVAYGRFMSLYQRTSTKKDGPLATANSRWSPQR